MAFGYEYWIVYLPKFNSESFLLFVHNPAESTKLRDYSGGRERVLGQPRLDEVRQSTDWGRTRFEESPHTVSGRNGEWYWQSRISDYNSRYLGTIKREGGIQKPGTSLPARTPEMECVGRAKRGSQRQLQDYVNLAPSSLDDAILSALPIKLQQNSPGIKWVSPLATEQFREFRDAEFLSILGLGQFSESLNSFWPESGPCWDALGILTTSLRGSQPTALLVEAKSHVAEVYGSGCQAGSRSRPLIEKSLNLAKNWCGARTDSDWMGALYQSANRIAHLYFIRQRLNRPCFLVNLYFVDDPYRPTSESEWREALEVIHDQLGLTTTVPGLIEVLLSGQPHPDKAERSSVDLEVVAKVPNELGGELAREAVPPPFLIAQRQDAPLSEKKSFAAWCSQWEMLGRFQSAFVPEAGERIRRVLELWQQEIPGRWQRGVDTQLLAGRYRRGDLWSPHPGEHTIEHQILVERFGKISLLGGTLIDGVNAFPLTCDYSGGGRCGNVEADMLLAVQSADGFRLVLCEVKADANDPWYAAIESLRQMRLFVTNPVGRAVMEKRGALPPSAADLPVTGLVLAPAGYYCARGKKGNAVTPAKRLFCEVRQHFGIDMRFAVWEPALNSIREL